MTKQGWLTAAEVFDHWRIVPRTVFFGYCAWVIWVTQYLLNWYTHIPAVERDGYSSGMVTILTSFITGMMPWIYKIYSDNSNDWSAQPAQVTQTRITQTTTASSAASNDGTQ